MASGGSADHALLNADSSLPSDPLNDVQPALTAEDPQFAAPMFNIHPSPQGIGGWLVLVAIGLVLCPFVLGRLISVDLHSLSFPTRALIGLRVPGLPALVGFELFANTLLLSGWLLLIVLFFREHRLFPRAFQLWMGFTLVARATEYALSFGLHTDSWDGAANLVTGLHASLGISVLRALVGAVLWITFMEKSERVKTTFVR